jgi:hypothetical protein
VALGGRHIAANKRPALTFVQFADDPVRGGIKRASSWLLVVGQFEFSAAFASRSSTSFMMSLLCGAWSC